MYCLDTNTVIHYFKGSGRVAENLLARSPAEMCIPSVVLYELLFGIIKSAAPAAKRSDFGRFLSVLTVLPLGVKEAEEAASLRSELEAKGTPIGPYDVLIAGTARANTATLVTHNIREFSRVDGLRLEDWHDG